jgi:DNA-binding transcriptional regulator YiaG
MKTDDTLLLIESRRALSDGRARALREAAGLSQSEVARTVRVTPQAVTRWETGSRVPRGDAALRYARFLARIGLQVPTPDAA